MRPVKRDTVPVPTGLDKTDKGQKTELERAREHIAGPAPKAGEFEFKVYKSDDVRLALEKLFHGKCAYCETVYATNAPVDIEHYRPKGAVAEDDAHPGYWWLAAAWENLLPSCIDCNRRRKQCAPANNDEVEYDEEARQFNRAHATSAGKGDRFPIAGTRAHGEHHALDEERALLLNPCEDNPSDHLRFNVQGAMPVALVFPRAVREGYGGAVTSPSDRGATSIEVYGLNRLGLVHERTRVLRHLNVLKEVIVDLSSAADAIESDDQLSKPKRDLLARRLRHLSDRLVEEIRHMARDSAPYSMMVRAWIAEFRNTLT
ncbi:HNH endonuclease family protein [Paraburkholderia bannensis]|uniref:hypothetical protein n=1 Tax=Paraburkholderia bannensis TaxID=765414 RepID=UPI002AC358BF|nr:hypothetical protein [Paraburkholderia bannensis]